MKKKKKENWLEKNTLVKIYLRGLIITYKPLLEGY